MDKLKIFKSCVGWIVGAGVAKIVTDVVDDHVEPENKYQQVTVFAGKAAITMVIREAVQETVDKKIDDAVEWYQTTIKKFV